jgi:TolB protein
VHNGGNCVSPILSWAVILCAVMGCAPGPMQPTPSPVMPAATTTMALWQTYSNPVFGISFEYPANWQRSPGDVERYGGVSGFFEIELISKETMTIDEVVATVLWDRIKAWADPGRTERLQIQGQEARLFVSEGQAPEYVEGEAWLLVQLPRPVQTAGQKYNFLELWADRDHVGDIVRTLRFP